jgi:hypothetical protein
MGFEREEKASMELYEPLPHIIFFKIKMVWGFTLSPMSGRVNQTRKGAEHDPSL